MKYAVLIVVFAFVSSLSQAQQLPVEIKVRPGIENLHWIVRDTDRFIHASSEMLEGDSILGFKLDRNRQYFLDISTNGSNTEIVELLSLSLNYKEIISVFGGLESGDHSYPFFTGEVGDTRKIIGGSNANIADFPWQVFLRADNFVCGGSIIGENWVVTAAHCVMDDNDKLIDVSKISIKVGTSESSNPDKGKTYSIREYIVHENYDSENYENDIALLKTNQPIDFENAEIIELISPEDSASGYSDPGVMAWVTGWGLTNVDPKVFPDYLQKVRLPIVSNATAASVWGLRPPTMIMAGYADATEDACNGDSGGPLAVPFGDSFKLAGIVSWGHKNCDTYGGYTRISAFYDWIRIHTGINDTYKPSIPAGDSIVCESDVADNYSTLSQPLATSWEWKLTPPEAGTLLYNSTQASVSWNKDFFGEVLLQVRNLTDGVLSSWTDREIALAADTRMTGQTSDTALCSGQVLKIGVEASGHNLIYNWYKGSTLVKTSSSGLISYADPKPAHSGIYKCEITGSCGSLTSDEIDIVVYPLTEILNQSFNTNLDFGDSTRIFVETAGHNLQYIWTHNDLELDINSPEIKIGEVKTDHTGLYHVLVEGTCGSLESRGVYLYVEPSGEGSVQVAQVWPSVSAGIVNIAVQDARLYTVSVYSSSGLLVMELPDRKYQTVIDLSGLAGTLCFVKVTGKELNEVYRVVITGGN